MIKNTKAGKVNFLLFLLFLFFSFNSLVFSIEKFEALEGNFIEINILDKVSSKTSNVTVIIGEELIFQNLVINILKCRNSKFDDDPEVTAYMQVKANINTL